MGKNSGEQKVTGALTVVHEDGTSPPDARISQPRFFDVGSLVESIIAKLRKREKVTVTLFSREDETNRETHDVHLSD